MAEKKIQTRIRQKVDTKANWDKATNFIPLKGEIIIYSDLNQAKIGDGTTKVGALPFLKGKADASDKNPTLAWGSKSTVATVDGVDIHVTMPSNPNTHQSIKTLNTNNTSAQTTSSSEAIVGSGTINLHKVAKTGSYNDLTNKPTIPTIPTNLVTTNTEQTITGKKIFEEEVGFGNYVDMSRTVAAAPTNLDFVNFRYRSGAINNVLILSGAGDYFYLAHRKPDFSIKASFEGNGETSDTYSASLGYTRGWLDYLTDWDYGTAWCVRPDKVSATTPAIIQIKFTRLLYTDVLRLILTGHNLEDSTGNNSGFLDNYTIEVCTNKDQDTWTTVVNRSNANDNIGKGLMYSLQTASYTECYGIRLKITKCHVNGQGAPFIRITTMQLRDYRPAIKFPDCLGVVSQNGGDVWGSLNTKNNLVTHAVFPELNDSWSLGDNTHQYAEAYAGCFYENHVALSDKYLAKSEVSTQQWKLTSTAGTVTTVNICVK